jgi:prepilin-type N-terminal cleavage/methylation domain-containing protein
MIMLSTHSPTSSGLYIPSSKGQGQSPRPRALRAFTLIEVMIAMTIFGVVMIAIYTSWASILRGSKVGLDAAAESQRTRLAMRAIREALTSAQLYVENSRYYWFMADTSGEHAELSLVSRLPESFPGSGLFGNQALRRISFTVEPGPGGNQLTLRQVPLLEPASAGSEPYEIVLAPNVNLFALEFWNTNTLEWDPDWPFTNQLPKLVKVALSVGPPHRRPSPADTAVETALVSSLAIPRSVQVPAIRRGVVNRGPQGEGEPPPLQPQR